MLTALITCYSAGVSSDICPAKREASKELSLPKLCKAPRTFDHQSTGNP